MPAMPKLKAFDALRTVFCGAVLLFHCNVFYNGLKAESTSPEWNAFLRDPRFFPVSLGGINAVPIFFAMSAFFVTLPLIDRLEKGGLAEPIYATLLSRYLRLATFLVATMLIGLATDLSFYTGAGGINWTKVLGFLGMVGNLLPGNMHGSWMVDVTALPCWSIVTDFQGSAALLLAVPLIHRHVGLKKWPLFALLFASLAARYYVVSLDPGCNNMLPTLGKFHPTSIMLSGGETAQKVLESHGVNMQDGPLGVKECPDISRRESTSSYLPKLYTPITTRITPFFVGALLAVNYFTATKRGPSRCSKAAGNVWFVLSWLFLTTLLLPVDVDNLPPMGVMTFMEVTNHTLLATAVAFVTFCAIVPPEHPYHAKRLAAIMNADVWATPAKYSAWAYALHWPVLIQLARYTDLPVGYGTGFLATLLTTLATAPLCLVARRLVEMPIESLRKKLVATLTQPIVPQSPVKTPRGKHQRNTFPMVDAPAGSPGKFALDGFLAKKAA